MACPPRKCLPSSESMPRQVSVHTLQPTVLFGHRLHLTGETDVHAAILCSPLIQGGAAHPLLAVQLSGRHAVFHLAQHTPDPGFCSTCLLYRTFLVHPAKKSLFPHPYRIGECTHILDRGHGHLTRPKPFRACHFQQGLASLGQSLRSFVCFRPDWRKAHHGFGLINAVNLHPPDLGKGTIAQRVGSLLHVSDVFPRRLSVNMYLFRDEIKDRHIMACSAARVYPCLALPLYSGVRSCA